MKISWDWGARIYGAIMMGLIVLIYVTLVRAASDRAAQNDMLLAVCRDTSETIRRDIESRTPPLDLDRVREQLTRIDARIEIVQQRLETIATTEPR
jgi:hypothetical protein